MDNNNLLSIFGMKNNNNRIIDDITNDPENFVLNLYKYTNDQLVSQIVYINNKHVKCLLSQVNLNDLDLIENNKPTCDIGILTKMYGTKHRKVLQLSIKNIDYVVRITKILYPYIEFIKSKISSPMKLSYIASDNFTNEVIIYSFIDDLLSPLKITNYINIKASSLLSISEYNNNINDYYNVLIMEYCNLGSMNTIDMNENFSKYIEYIHYELNNTNPKSLAKLIKKDILLNIHKQILIVLDCLQYECEFIHGNLKASNILLVSRPYNYEYESSVNKIKINVNSEITVKISDFSKSSLSCDSIEPLCIIPYFNIDYYTSIIINRNVYNNKYYYNFEIPNNTIDKVEISNVDVNFYQTLDIYVYIISILLVPEVFRTVFSNSDIKTVMWDPLWIDDNDEIIMFNLLKTNIKNNLNNTTTNVIQMLQKVKLNLSILEDYIMQIREF